MESAFAWVRDADAVNQQAGGVPMRLRPRTLSDVETDSPA